MLQVKLDLDFHSGVQQLQQKLKNLTHSAFQDEVCSCVELCCSCESCGVSRCLQCV